MKCSLNYGISRMSVRSLEEGKDAGKERRKTMQGEMFAYILSGVNALETQHGGKIDLRVPLVMR